MKTSQFTLCEITGVLARDGQCVAHGGDACLHEFVPADPEWHQMREQLRRALALAELIERDVSDMGRKLDMRRRQWRERRHNLFGEPIRPILDGGVADPDRNTT